MAFHYVTYQKKGKTNMPFGKEMMGTVHYEIKLYPLKIHSTWNNLLLFLEVDDFTLIKKERNNSNKTKSIIYILKSKEDGKVRFIVFEYLAISNPFLCL